MVNLRIKRFMSNFDKYKSLLSELIRRDIKIKYRRSILGILWSFLDPLFYMVVLTVVFSTLFHRIPNYPVYYLIGMLAYMFFAGGSTYAMGSMIGMSGIWKSIYVPKYLYVLSAVLSNFVTYLLSLIVLFAIMLILKVPFTVYILLAPLPILALIIQTIGVGLIVATLNVFFRDIEHLYSVFTMILMYGTPIFYPPDIMPAAFRFVQTYNPLFNVIDCLRSCFMYGRIFNLQSLLFAFVSGFVLLIIGLILFYKYQDRFILYV